MIVKLNVKLKLPAGEIVKVGELVVNEPDFRGALKGQFRYDLGYLDSSKAFALDPLHLPLRLESFEADRLRSGVHGVFEDSLPDDWGRKIMARRYNLDRVEQRVPYLLRLLGGQGLGALVYIGSNIQPHLPVEVSSHHLEKLALSAEKFEQDPFAQGDNELLMLFQAGSSPGGARPKALVVDNNEAYLAKFASAKDAVDVVALEAATMELSRRSGIKTAATRLMSLGSRKCLLVKRFDINEAGGRNHLISMQSLLKADDYYTAGYRNMAEVIKHVSAEPRKDLHMLYRQMVFNVMVGNTDDHLKNFCMLHSDEGWRLSLAFDLVPNIGFNQEHVLHIGFNNRPHDATLLLAEAKYFGIKHRQVALGIMRKIYTVVSDWHTVFSEFGVPNKDSRTIGHDINRRLDKLSPFGDHLYLS